MPILIFLVLAVTLLVIVIASASAADSWAAAQQAQAAIEAARAAKTAALGQTAASFGLTLAVIFLVLLDLAAIALIVFLVLRMRKLQGAQSPQPKWLPGPNARWGRLAEGQPRRSLPAPDPVQQLIQLELLRYLRDMRPNQPARLPPHTPEEEEDAPLW